jgi:hypothetical protein
MRFPTKRVNFNDAYRLATILLFVYVGFIAAFGFFRGNVHTGDTDNLVKGTRAALDCLHLHVFRGCGLTPGSRATAVFPYPLLQYLPAAVLIKLGFSDPSVLRGLAGLSMLSYASAFILVRRLVAPRADRIWGPVLALVLIASPLSYYAVSSFGEMLSLVTILAASVAALGKRTWPAVLLVFVGGLTKETMPPFVLGIVLLIAWRAEADVPRRLRTSLLGLSGLCAFATNLLFNVFRFATWRNLNYLSPEFNVPLLRRADFYAMLLFAPQGGLLWFWPVALGLLALVGVSLMLPRVPDCETAERRLVIALLLLWAAFLAGSASWVSPFGWIAWGPRLSLPLIPALAVASVSVSGVRLQALIRWIGARRGLSIAIGAFVVLSALPQLALPWSHGRAIGALIAADDVCPGLMDTPVQRDRDLYFRCTSHVAWRLHPNQLSQALRINPWQAWIARGIGTAAVVSLLIAIWLGVKPARRK